jgi:hypothetical protein
MIPAVRLPPQSRDLTVRLFHSGANARADA